MYSDENAAILGHSVDQELEEHSLGLQQFHASNNISNLFPASSQNLKNNLGFWDLLPVDVVLTTCIAGAKRGLERVIDGY